MHILRLLRLDQNLPSWGALYITVLAGVANASLIALINMAAEQTALGEPIGAKTILLYVVAFAIFMIANHASLQHASQFLQNRLSDLRIRIANKIQNADLRTLENLGHGRIYSTLAQEMNHLSHHFSLLASAGQSFVLLILCLIYIAFLSTIAFVVILAATSIAMFLFWRQRQALNKGLKEVNVHESKMLSSLQNYTDGFQEIRMNADKNDALHESFQTIVDDLEDVVVGIGGKWVVLLLFSNAFLYALVGIVVFVLPLFFQGYTDTIYKIVTASIFLVGPIAAITSAAPLFAKANIGLGHVFDLERYLEDGQTDFSVKQDVDESIFRDFKTIHFENMEFAYRNEDGNVTFSTGPWSLDIKRGERIFLLGGNGSGKSSALKLISGLYAHDGGTIRVDGKEINKESMQAYRSLFTCIFPEFHLFGKLYGYEDADPKRVKELISWMQLEDKVEFVDGAFSTQDLSTGQRKRLAMVVSLLEDRDIYLFDEWAADQDAYFRDAFYTDILEKLKQEGKTVVVVTHDDRYWHMSERTITLEVGHMTKGMPFSSKMIGDD